ncbi:MAG: HAD hydrolase family protein, partial [Candidatus Obscuribacterales bacterium]|nr:HAD hydrolase family protein [Candidatus Obscuribacterales bacterium]
MVASPEVLEKAASTAILLMDVDGVLTDGRIYYVSDRDGKPCEFKGFDSQDGLGLLMLHEAGIKSGVISGRESIATAERARLLGITHVYQGFLEKEASFSEILSIEGIDAGAAAFVGDDFTDLPLMKKSGFACAVANARPELLEHADYVATRGGGRGAIREIVELILRAKGLWDQALAKYG